MDNLAGPSGRRSHPLCSDTASVRQHRDAHPAPHRREQRTRAACRRSRVRRPCVRRRRKLRIVRFRASARASLCCGSSPNRTRYAGLRFGFGERQGFSPHTTIVLNVINNRDSRPPFAVQRPGSLAPQVPPANTGPEKQPVPRENRWKRQTMPTGELCPNYIIIKEFLWHIS